MKQETKLESIKKSIDEIFNLDTADRTRKNKYVVARILYCKISKMETKYSYRQIGEVVNRDHSSVIHNIGSFPRLFQFPEYVDDINAVLILYGLPKLREEIPTDSYELRKTVVKLQRENEKLREGLDPVFARLSSLPESKLKEFKEYRAEPFLRMHG